MIYSINTEGVRFDRVQEDVESLLRIYNVGENPVRVRINSGEFGDAFIRNQFIDITITKTPVYVKAIGGESKIRTYRVYGNNKDECDISGLFEPITEESFASLIEQKAVQRDDVVQQLDNSEVNVPSTAAVSKAIKNVVSEIGAVLVYRGSVQKYTDLPTTDRIAGDTWNVVEPYLNYGAGTNFAWTGDKWDALGAQALDVEALKEYNTNAEQKTREYNENHRVKLAEYNSNATNTLTHYNNNASNKFEEYNTNAEQKTRALETIQEYCEESRAFVETARIEVKQDKEIAQTSASSAEYWAKQAQEISDPENRIGNLQSDVKDLQVGKANSGVLHFDGGSAITSKKFTMGQPFTFVFRYQMTESDWEKWDVAENGSRLGTAYMTYGDGFVIKRFNKTDTDSYIGVIAYKSSSIRYFKPILDGKPHTIVYAFNGKYFDGTNNTLFCYHDSDLKFSFRYVPAEPDNLSSLGLGLRKLYGNFSDVYFFNFDITAEAAPYTINDYQISKPIPPNLLNPLAEQRAEIALENYKFNGEVLDYSGNGKHATVSGSVAGDNDRKVETLFEKISARIANQTNG